LIVSILNIMSTSWLYTRFHDETLYAVPGIRLHVSRVHGVGGCLIFRICLHLCILNLKLLPTVAKCCVVTMNCDEGFLAEQFNDSVQIQYMIQSFKIQQVYLSALLCFAFIAILIRV
jgi:hypothetical protein